MIEMSIDRPREDAVDVRVAPRLLAASDRRRPVPGLLAAPDRVAR
jgi:hypothetical protein